MKSLNHIPKRQRGMTLLVAMITLIVLMLMGVGAMVASNTMFKLAGNLQFENEAKNRAESALTKAESWLMNGGSTNAGFNTTSAPFYDPTAVLTPLTNWPSAASSTATNEQFIVQQITTANTKVTPPGNAAGLDGGTGAVSLPPTYNLFRVTARGQAGRGATRFVESIVQVP